jgi:SAM-dependent methyltransferase
LTQPLSRLKDVFTLAPQAHARLVPCETPPAQPRPTGDRLHLGCGLNTPDGWIHLDASRGAWLAKHPILKWIANALRLAPSEQFDVPWSKNIVVHDVRKPLPFPDGSLSAVYASHLLEHLHFDEGQRLLAECRRVLAPGGVLRLVVPDLRTIVREYLHGIPGAASGGVETNAADRLNRRLLLRPPSVPKRSFFYRWYSANEFHAHKWMYDAESLVDHMCRAGFDEVQERPVHDSRIAGIEDIERAERVIGGAGVCIEGLRPQSADV